MNNNAMHARVCECAEPTSAEVRAEANRKDNEAIYWGIRCKTCGGLVAFDIAPYVSFGPAAASMKRGAIRCGRGHIHIYFPRDFGFRGSAVPVADAAMRENRDVYRAINSPGHRTSHDFVAPADEPPAKPEAGEPPGELESSTARSVKIGSDPRREAARLAAKERWANWAARKMA